MLYNYFKKYLEKNNKFKLIIPILLNIIFPQYYKI